MPETQDLLDTRSAAAYLGVSPNTLKQYRTMRRGPKYILDERNPRWIRYRRSDLDDYKADHDAAVASFAARSVALVDALSKIDGTDLDDQLIRLMRADTAARKQDKPALADFYRRLSELLLHEFARRERKPTLTAPKTARKTAPARLEPSPYL